MKEATGELSMTVVVIIAVIVILTILTVILLPRMQQYIEGTWNDMDRTKDQAVERVTP